MFCLSWLVPAPLHQSSLRALALYYVEVALSSLVWVRASLILPADVPGGRVWFLSEGERLNEQTPLNGVRIFVDVVDEEGS